MRVHDFQQAVRSAKTKGLTHLNTYGQLNESDLGGEKTFGEILGVFGHADSDECYKCEGLHSFDRFFEPSAWDQYMRRYPGRLFVFIRMTNETMERHKLSHWSAGIIMSTSTTSDPRSLVLAKERGVLHNQSGLFLEHAYNYRDQSLPMAVFFEFLNLSNPLWLFLSEYDKIRQPGEPSVNDIFNRMAGKEMLHEPHTPPDADYVENIFGLVKRWIVRYRRTPGKLMSVLRRKFPEEYEKAFPDDTESELGEMGF